MASNSWLVNSHKFQFETMIGLKIIEDLC